MFFLGENEYELHHGDCIVHMAAMPEASIDLMITSVPFASLYAYTDQACDIGNSEDLHSEARIHFGYWFHGLRRVMKPGRVAMVHCMQIPRMKRTGLSGLFDFRGFLIRLGQRAGLIYEYDWAVRKNPQAQAIRTKSRQLQFSGLESDRAASRGTLADYLIKFRAPGENAVAVDSEYDVSRNDWIEWAECTWHDIKETDTLNVREAKGEKDTKHICPLQLGLIERLVRLYTNPGEIVFDPFAGICSTGFVALGGMSPVTQRGIKSRARRFYGCEIKDEYVKTGTENLERAIQIRHREEKSLFDSVAV